MLQLGVAGVGQQFSSFREVLRRLRNPVEIDAVYDCVFARAETVAAQEEAAWESGLRALGRRHSVDAVLLLDPGWHGVPGLHCLAGCHKPVFVSRWLSGTAADFERLYEASTEHGVSLMPALWRRYVPAALRVQELVATEIGAVTEIEIELPVSSADNPLLLSEMLVGWLDFCRNLFRTFPIGSRFEPSLAGRETSRETTTSDRDGETESRPALSLIVDYPGSASDADPEPTPGIRSGIPVNLSSHRARRAILRLVATGGIDLLEAVRSSLLPRATAGQSAAASRGGIVPVRISCERGWAEIRAASEVAWQISDQPVEAEKLTADRSEHDIMLDLFCRRVAGGLIPVPDFFDVSHALRVVEQAVTAP